MRPRLRLPAASIRLLAVALSVATLGVGVAYGSKSVGGADSYGYVSQADLWLEGRLVDPAPWIGQVPWPGAQHSFTPLGWVPRGSESVVVPQYAPGLPLLMALAKLLAGHCAVFWVAPISAALAVYATFALGRRLLSAGAGLGAAWLVATSPTFLLMSLSPMSDVPVTAAWVLAWLAVAGNTVPRAAAAGFLASVAVLIRPNLAPLAVPLAAWLGVQALTAAGPGRRAALAKGAAFLAAAAPGLAAVGLINNVRYGSPLLSGYGDLSLLYAWANFGPNVSRYAGWFVETHTIVPVAGLVALALPVRYFWPEAHLRGLVAALGVFVLIVCATYFPYLVFEDFSFLRFFLPCLPFIMIGCLAALRPVARLAGMAGRALMVVLVMATGGWTLSFAIDDGVFRTAHVEGKFHVAGSLVKRIAEPGSVLISRQHGGSLRYYTGLMTMNFDGLDKEWLDRAVAWFAERGIKTYAVLEEWEIAGFRERFSPLNRLGRLASPPSLIYVGPATVYVYDFSRPELPAETLRWPDIDRGPACVPPQPKPVLRLTELPR